MKLRFLCLILFVQAYSGHHTFGQTQARFKNEIVKILKPLVMDEAKRAMQQEPVTITSTVCERSAGGKHDFYSEGDYWWPDPENPGGPYIQRDGQTNPDNFVAHRYAMIRFSRLIGSLASAYVLTGEKKYVDQAFKHCKSWFVDTSTRMNPSLLYAQAIKGRVTGRGIGIIDTIHLMEVAQGIYVMQNAPGVDKILLIAVKNWFVEYLQWLTTHAYGIAEMTAENNHGTCWVMQVAAFTKLTENDSILNICKDRFKNVLMPNQMANDGSFPRELRRTKPFGYSLFNLDAMATICQVLSSPDIDLWSYQTPAGTSIKKGIEFMLPFISDKSKWPFNKDVMYWDQWPVAHPFLIFGAVAYNEKHWLEYWKNLEHNPLEDEIVRNLPIRNPIIWIP